MKLLWKLAPTSLWWRHHQRHHEFKLIHPGYELCDCGEKRFTVGGKQFIAAVIDFLPDKIKEAYYLEYGLEPDPVPYYPDGV